MKIKLLFVFLLFTFRLVLFGQSSLPSPTLISDSKNEISLSVPFLWAKYEVTNTWGIFGPDKQSNGDSWSNGFNVTYNRRIFNRFFIIAGIGYFKQNFDFSKSRTPSSGSIRTSNSRPFLYDSQDQILFSTTHYSYSNYHFIVGITYNYPISRKFYIKGGITYNQMNTYNQKYYPNHANYAPQVNRSNYLFSKSFILSFGGGFKLNKKISVNVSFLLPLSTQYRKDYIFMENTNEYFKPTSTYGFNPSINYNF